MLGQPCTWNPGPCNAIVDSYREDHRHKAHGVLCSYQHWHSERNPLVSLGNDTALLRARGFLNQSHALTVLKPITVLEVNQGSMH